MDNLQRRVQQGLNKFHTNIANNIVKSVAQAPQPVKQLASSIRNNPQVITNRIHSPLSPTLGDIPSIYGQQKFKIPRYDLVSKVNAKNPIRNFLLKAAAGIPEDIINAPSDYQRGIGNVNKGNLLQGVGQAGKAMFNIGTIGGGTVATGIAKGVVRQAGVPALMQAIKQGVVAGGAVGGGYGALSGLASSSDTKEQLKQVVLQGGMSALGGAVLGGAVGGAGNRLQVFKASKLSMENAAYLPQLRDALGKFARGEFVKDSAPVKPKGMPNAQWKFQIKFNERYQRNPYEPVFSSTLQESIKYEAGKRQLGFSIRDINKDKNPLGTPDVANAGLGDTPLANEAVQNLRTQGVVSQPTGPQGRLMPELNNASIEANANPAFSRSGALGQQPSPLQSQKGQSLQQRGSPKVVQSASSDDIIAQAKNEISDGKPKVDKRSIKEFADDVYTSWVDRFHPITKVAGQVEDLGKQSGFELRPENNPRFTLKRYLGAGGIAENRFNSEFKPILDEVDNLKISKDDLDIYLKNRRDVGFGEAGRDIYGSDPVKAQAVVQAVEGKHGEGIKQIADKIYAYQNKMFDELVNAGFIDKTKAKTIRSQNPDYVPFVRDMEGELDNYLGIPSVKLQQGSNPISKIKGSEKQILSPIESVIANTFKYRAAIEKNNVASSIVGLQKAMPELGFSKVAQSGNDTITVWENGAKNYYQVGNDISEVARGMNEEQMNSLLKILSVPSSILRQGATGRNPAFMIPNMVRDQLDAALNSKYGYVPFVDFARGLAHIWKKDEVYQKWQQSGAQISLSDLAGRKGIRESFNEKQGKKKLFSWVGAGLDKLGAISEQPTRIGLFEKAYKKTGNPLIGAMESREGTLDFSRMGSKMKVANSLIPFLNVGVQGFDKMARVAKANPGRFAVKMAAYGAAPTIATTLWNTQNFPEEYKEIPQFDKNANFVIVTGRNAEGTVDYIAIPKGNVVQYISNPIENFLAYASDTNSQTVKEMAIQFISSSLPVVGDGSSLSEVALKTVGSNLPQAIKPITENLLNKSFYKYNTKNDEAKEITPYFMKKKAPGDQSYDFTPGAYKTIGHALNISPLKVQNFLEGHLAGYVKEPLGIYATAKAIADGEGVDRNKAFLLRRFLKTTFPTSNPKTNNKTISNNQTKQKESGLLDSANASSVVDNKLVYFDNSGNEQTFDLAPKTSGAGIGALANTDWKEKQAAKLWNLEGIDQATKNKQFKQWGIDPKDARYAALAGYNEDVSAQFIAQKSQSHDALINNILTGRVVGITGSQFASNGVITKLNEEGLLSDAEAKALKKVKIDKDGNSLTKATGKVKKLTIAKIGSRKAPAFKVKKAPKLRFKKVSSKNKKVAQLKVAKYKAYKKPKLI